MTAIAGVGNFQRIGFAWRYKAKRVAANVHVCNGLLYFGHVAANALIALTSDLMVSVRFYCGRVRAIRRIRTMAFQAHDVRRFQEIRIIAGSMNIVAIETAHAVRIHNTLNEVVALHAVFVCGSVREMGERLLAQLVFF